MFTYTASEQEMIDRHRDENTALILEKMDRGESPYKMTREDWAVSDRQKAEWSALRGDTRPTVVTETDENGNEVMRVVAKAERVCRDCGDTLPPPVGRGRPPVRCETCRAA